VSFSGGFNSLATGKSIPLPATVGREWLGMAASDRMLSSELTTTDFNRATQSQLNGLIRGLPRDWLFEEEKGLPNMSTSLSFGGEDPILFGHPLGYVGSLSYSRSQEVKDDVVRSRAIPGDAQGTPKADNVFTGSTGQRSVLWGGLLNLSTYLGQGHKLDFSNTYDRTADNEAHEDWGTLEEFAQVDSIRRTSLRYVERTIRSNQLRGVHLLNQSNKIEWAFTSSGVTRVEPDRADIAYGYEFAANGQRLPLAWLGFIPDAARRTTGDLKEDALNGDLGYTLTLGSGDGMSTIKVGGAYRHTQRDATAASFNLRALGLGAQQRAASPEDLFYGSYTAGGAANITLEPNSSGGAYNATDQVTAGYAMAELPVGSKLRLIGGARVERWELDMTAEPTSRALMTIERTNTDVLPSLTLNAKLTETQNLRLSVSQTLARPEYRELAPISYRDMLGDREVFGDSSLVRTIVQNLDLRWEWYPTASELMSIGLFAKRFDNPIEQIDVATSGASQLSFVNAESATNYGLELELRKGLEFLGESMLPFSVFANATLMHSQINTSNSGISALSNDKRPMVGQAPYVVNGGLAYASESGSTSATLLYNVVGRRIVSAAIVPLNADTYEEPRHGIDFSIRFGLPRGVSAKLDAKNLLDSPYEERQGDVIRYAYKSGRSLSLGLSWKVQ
jgi:TonB-dependent receptor